MTHIPTDAELHSLLENSERAELELLRDAVNAATNTILVTDPRQADNPIVFVNRGFERLTGYRTDEVLGKNCRFLQAGDTEQIGVLQLREAIAAREPVVVELRNYRRDGTLFWNELHVSPVIKHGHLLYFFGVQHDITARKELETLLSKAQESLLVQNIENKRDIAEKNRYVLQLARQMQHPLTTVLGFTDLLAEASKTAPLMNEGAQYTAIIKDSARTLETYLNNLLELLRPENDLITESPSSRPKER